MSVQQELTVDQTIRRDALDRSITLHRYRDSPTPSARDVLVSAEAFAEFIKSAAIPAGDMEARA